MRLGMMDFHRLCRDMVGRCRLTLSTPSWKPPGTQRLKLIYDGTLSTLAINSNLRRYNMEVDRPGYGAEGEIGSQAITKHQVEQVFVKCNYEGEGAKSTVGAYTRPLKA
jgi:hypothetical protein